MRVHTVNKARKDYSSHGIKKGDTYYWWEFRYGGKQMSKTYPRPSQLTSNGALATVLAGQEALQDELARIRTEVETEGVELDFSSLYDDLESAISTAKDEAESAKSEIEGSLDNMPEGLRESSNTGQTLQERMDNIDSWINELDGVSCGEDDDTGTADDRKEALLSKIEEAEGACESLEV